MQRKARVVVVGSSNTDMVVKTPRIPAPGETVLGNDYLMVAGGKGANQAVAAARLGADTTFVARVGNDVFGDRAITNIGLAGVNTKYIVRDASTPSGIALIAVDQSGQNSIVVAQGANAKLSPDDVIAARPALEEADVVVMQFEIPIETVAYTIAIAKELGKVVVLNPAPVIPLPADFLTGVDVITPNEVEANMLLGRDKNADFDGKEAAKELLKRGVKSVVLTMGSQGAIAASHDRIQEVPPKRVTAVDTTAAGDCFAGALAVALGEGQSLNQAVYFANAAAALSVTRMGAQTSMPLRSEVESYIKSRG